MSGGTEPDEQEEREAVTALHAAIERLVRLYPTFTEEGEVIPPDPDDPLVVVEYVVVAYSQSFRGVEGETSTYTHVRRDAQGRSLPPHHSIGLIERARRKLDAED